MEGPTDHLINLSPEQLLSNHNKAWQTLDFKQVEAPVLDATISELTIMLVALYCSSLVSPHIHSCKSENTNNKA